MKEQSNKRFNGYLFYFLLALFLFLVFVRYVLQITYPPILLLALTCAMAFWGDRSEILIVCMISIPFASAFSYELALMFACGMYILKYRNDIRINLSVIPIIFLVIWELLHGYSGAFSFKHLIGMFIPFFVVCLLIWQDANELNYEIIVRVFALSVTLLCLIFIVSAFIKSGFNLNNFSLYVSRLGDVVDDTNAVNMQINPNSLGIQCVIAVSGLTQLIICGKKKSTDIPFVVLLLVCGALTLSKTYLALVLIMGFLFILDYDGESKKKVNFILKLVAVTLATFVVFKLVFPVAFENFLLRFKVSDLTTGRAYLFVAYNEFFMSSLQTLFFGIGLTDFSSRASKVTGIFGVPHNGFQEAILAWGVIGFLAFLVFLGMMIKFSYIPGKKKALRNYIPLILLIAKIQAGQMLTSSYTMLLFSYCYLSLAQNFEVNSLEPNT